MASATANPMNARLTDVQSISQTLPSSMVVAKACQTSTGAGTLNSSVIAEAQTSCHTTRNNTSATSGGTPVFSARRHHGVVCVAGVSSASRPATAAAASSRTAVAAGPVSRSPSGPCESCCGSGSCGMTGDDLSEASGDLVVQVQRPPADPPLADDGPRPRREQHHPLGQPDRLPHVVGDEQDRRPGGLPDP